MKIEEILELVAEELAWLPSMPESPKVLGFAGRWYPAAARSAEARTLASGRVIRTLSIAYLLALKLEAWNDRGRRDPTASKDLEDVMALLEGCAELEAGVGEAPAELRARIAAALGEILADSVVLEIALGQLPIRGDAEGRARRVVERLRRLAATP